MGELINNNSRIMRKELRGASRGIQEKMAALLGAAKLNTLSPESFCVYGSSLPSLWNNTPYNNINIGFLDGCSKNKYDSMLKSEIAISIHTSVMSDIDDLIESIDFTVCQIVYYNGCFYFVDSFFERLAEKLLIVNRINVQPQITLLRTFKYLSRGYLISYNELCKILAAVKTSSFLYLTQDAIDIHSGSVLLSHDYQGSNVVLRLPVIEFPRLLKNVMDIKRVLQLDTYEGVYLFGSLVKSALTGEQVNDVDISFGHSSDYNKVYEKFIEQGYEITLETERSVFFNNNFNLSKKHYSSLEELFAQAEYTMSMLVVDLQNDEICFGPETFSHIFQKILVQKPSHNEFTSIDVNWACKYIRRGYRLSRYDIFVDLQKVPLIKM